MIVYYQNSSVCKIPCCPRVHRAWELARDVNFFPMVKGSGVSSAFGLEDKKMSRSYMMTVWFDKNGQTFEEKTEKMQALYDGGLIRYACLSQEICPETGRLHGHLFTRFVDSWSGVKAFTAYGIETGGGWFEGARKDFPSFEYVSCCGHFAEGQPKGKPKPLRFFEIGERPKSETVSKKKDFAACFAMLQEGRPLLEVCAAYPEIALKGFTNLQKLSELIKGEKQNELQRKKLERVLAKSHDSAIEPGTQEETASDRTPEKTRVSPEFYARNVIETESKAVPF